MRGPAPSDAYVDGIARVMADRDNVHYHGTVRANDSDSAAMRAVLEARYAGGRAVLSAHEAAHIREVRAARTRLYLCVLLV